MEQIIKNQPIVNIGTLGHVANGKSSLTRAMSEKVTQQYKKEIDTNKTIKLGYANCKIYKCSCIDPSCYHPMPSSTEDTRIPCSKCSSDMELVTHVSFVDSPGHNLLMATMLNGACIMDTAMLVEAANHDKVPAPQTAEHLLVSEIMNLNNPFVVLNKIDLVTKAVAKDKIDDLKKHFKGTKLEEAPIIPASANFKVNIDYICKHIVENVKIEDKQYDSDCEMIVVRSFNINKQFSELKDLHGGVVGGSIVTGKLKVGDKVTIVPGFIVKNPSKSTEFAYQPIKSTVVKIKSEKNELESAVAGGLIATELKIDPYFTLQDKMIGNIVLSGEVNDYRVLEQFTVEYRTISSKNVEQIRKEELVSINCNAKNTECVVLSIKGNKITFVARTEPICTKLGHRISVSKVSRKSGPRLMGYGDVIDGVQSSLL